jgi:hypothetical protein
MRRSNKDWRRVSEVVSGRTAENKKPGSSPGFFHCGTALERAIAQWIEEHDR